MDVSWLFLCGACMGVNPGVSNAKDRIFCKSAAAELDMTLLISMGCNGVLISVVEGAMNE
jgi:hypothetical protein